jgi:neutral ceramidase
LTDLWAKALCLEDASGQCCVAVTLDLIGIDRELSQAICNQLAEQYGLKRSQIALCTSHTHTGPVVARNLQSMHYALLDEAQRKLVEQYSDTVLRQIVACVGQALSELQPADVAWGSGVATFAVNRRNNPEAKVPELRVAGKLAGPRDHDVPVLLVRSPQGELRAVLFGYACHATTLSSYQWSGDYAGFAQMTLERDFPGCTALFWAGCGGDQNPLPRREVALAQQYGHELAAAVKQVLESDVTRLTPVLATEYKEISLPLDTLPSRAELEHQRQDDNPYVASRARLLLQQLDQGQPLAATYPYPVQTWRLGDTIQFAFLGGEVVVDYAVRLKSELQGLQTWVAGYANDVMAYIPSRRVLSEGGYEGGGAMVYYGLPTAWAPEVEQRIVEAVREQLR